MWPKYRDADCPCCKSSGLNCDCDCDRFIVTEIVNQIVWIVPWRKRKMRVGGRRVLFFVSDNVRCGTACVSAPGWQGADNVRAPLNSTKTIDPIRCPKNTGIWMSSKEMCQTFPVDHLCLPYGRGWNKASKKTNKQNKEESSRGRTSSVLASDRDQRHAQWRLDRDCRFALQCCALMLRCVPWNIERPREIPNTALWVISTTRRHEHAADCSSAHPNL